MEKFYFIKKELVFHYLLLITCKGTADLEVNNELNPESGHFDKKKSARPPKLKISSVS